MNSLRQLVKQGDKENDIAEAVGEIETIAKTFKVLGLDQNEKSAKVFANAVDLILQVLQVFQTGGSFAKLGQCMQALGTIGLVHHALAKEILPKLSVVLRKEHWLVRLDAAKALGGGAQAYKGLAEQAFHPLSTALQEDTDPLARQAAAKALEYLQRVHPDLVNN